MPVHQDLNIAQITDSDIGLLANIDFTVKGSEPTPLQYGKWFT